MSAGNASAPGDGAIQEATSAALRRQLLERRLRRSSSARRPRIEPVDRTGAIPLSFEQERLWFLDQLEPRNGEYVVPIGLRLRGGLSVPALRAALAEIVARHEALRTRFELIGRHPRQVIEPPRPIIVERIERPGVPGEVRDAVLQSLLSAAAEEGFDLTQSPIFRAALVAFAPDDHGLLITIHHIAVDAWSVDVLLAELAALYDAFSRGRTAELAPLPVQVADYAVWQRQQAQSSTAQDGIAYWRELLAGIPPLELPADWPRPARRTSLGATCSLELGSALTSSVRDLSRAHDVTPFMTLFAAFQALAARISGQRSFLVGVPAGGRPDRSLEPLIGFFTNVLCLRCDVDPAEQFSQLLDRTRKMVAEALSRQVPFERLVVELAPERDPGRTPLFQVMFAFDAPKVNRLELGGLDVDFLPAAFERAKYDLTFNLGDLPSGIHGTVQYATALFDHQTAVDLGRLYRRMLEQVARRPATRLGEIEVLSGPDREKICLTWNGTDTAFPDADCCVHELIADQARRTPHAVAVRFEGTDVTYRELAQDADAIARALRQRGVGVEDVVGVLMERSHELVAALLGILKAGATYLPLDPDLPRARLELVVREASAQVVLTDNRHDDLLPAPVVVLPIRAATAAGADAAPVGDTVRAMPENLAYVIFTSGSTGVPKGVGVTHAGIVNRLRWMQRELDLTASDRVLQKTPISFDVSVWEIFWPLMAGATLVVARPGGHRDPGYLAHVIRHEGVTTAHFVPSMLGVFLAEEPLSEVAALSRVICSGEPLTPALAAEFFRRLPARLDNMYGPTEASIDVTAARIQPGDTVIPIGRPAANTRAYVVDGEGRLVVPGAAGDLLLGGVQLARGYVDQPGLTAERFVPDPFGPPGGRLYRTGDIARFRRDGQLEFLGRCDGQVKICGFRVELGEIESVLGRHPDVAAAAVTVRGTEHPRLDAYVVRHDGAPRDANALRAFAAERLPAYMVPDRFAFLDAIPLTSSGKLDRNSLPATAAIATSGHGHAEPCSAGEKKLAAIWEDVLDVERVGLNDNFFDLGGNSLLAVVVAARVREDLGESMPISLLLERPTIGTLAQVLGDERRLPRQGPLVPLKVAGTKQPVFCIHPLGGHVFVYLQLAHLLSADIPFYALRARGLDADGEPYHHIDEMAAHYISYMRKIQPRGPYTVGGWCMGAVVAYEVERQLRESGEEVDLLFLMSASAVEHMPAWEVEDDAAFTGYLLAGYMPEADENSILAERTNVPLDLAHMRGLALDDKLRYVMQEAAARGALKPNVTTVDEARQLYTVYAAHRDALAEYQLAPAGAPVVLFKAENNHLKDTPGGDLGWNPLAPLGLRVHTVPGHHWNMLDHPNVRTVSRLLGESLRASRPAMALADGYGRTG